MATHNSTNDRCISSQQGHGRSTLARSDTASIAESFFERSELLRPPREDLVNQYFANVSVSRDLSRWWIPSITGRMLFARSDTAGSIIDLSPPPRSALLRWYQEISTGRNRMKWHRWRTPPIRDGMHPPAVGEIPQYLEGSSPEGTGPPIRGDGMAIPIDRNMQGSSVPI